MLLGLTGIPQLVTNAATRIPIFCHPAQEEQEEDDDDSIGGCCGRSRM